MCARIGQPSFAFCDASSKNIYAIRVFYFQWGLSVAARTQLAAGGQFKFEESIGFDFGWEREREHVLPCLSCLLALFPFTLISSHSLRFLFISKKWLFILKKSTTTTDSQVFQFRNISYNSDHLHLNIRFLSLLLAPSLSLSNMDMNALSIYKFKKLHWQVSSSTTISIFPPKLLSVSLHPFIFARTRDEKKNVLTKLTANEPRFFLIQMHNSHWNQICGWKVSCTKFVHQMCYMYVFFCLSLPVFLYPLSLFRLLSSFVFDNNCREDKQENDNVIHFYIGCYYYFRALRKKHERAFTTTSWKKHICNLIHKYRLFEQNLVLVFPLTLMGISCSLNQIGEKITKLIIKT